MKSVTRFIHLIDDLMQDHHHTEVAELIDTIVERTGYRSFLTENGEQGRERWENVQELRSTALKFQNVDPEDRLSEFLQGVALVSDLDTLEENQDSITLITLHQAKGLEFPVVFIMGLEEGLLPHIRSFDNPDQIEEERRLFYVGMTRAKERLYINRAFRRGFRDGNTNRPSRFLSDIPQHLISPIVQSEQRGLYSSRTDVLSSANTRESEPLKVGERVKHSTFGDGIVVSCIASGHDHEVTVAFKGPSGIKKLLLSYAGLELETPRLE